MATAICPWCGKKVDRFIMFRGDIVGCQYCGIHTKHTNADRIRLMSDEELAEWIARWSTMPPKLNREEWLFWLKEEVKE